MRAGTNDRGRWRVNARVSFVSKPTVAVSRSREPPLFSSFTSCAKAISDPGTTDKIVRVRWGRHRLLMLLFLRVIDEVQLLAFTGIVGSVGDQDCIGPGVFAIQVHRIFGDIAAR